jgi:hypothetical protein
MARSINVAGEHDDELRAIVAGIMKGYSAGVTEQWPLMPLRERAVVMVNIPPLAVISAIAHREIVFLGIKGLRVDLKSESWSA